MKMNKGFGWLVFAFVGMIVMYLGSTGQLIGNEGGVPPGELPEGVTSSDINTYVQDNVPPNLSLYEQWDIATEPFAPDAMANAELLCAGLGGSWHKPPVYTEDVGCYGVSIPGGTCSTEEAAVLANTCHSFGGTWTCREGAIGMVSCRR